MSKKGKEKKETTPLHTAHFGWTWSRCRVVVVVVSLFFRISFTHLLFPIYLILKTRRRIKIRASNKKEEKNETNNTTAHCALRTDGRGLGVMRRW